MTRLLPPLPLRRWTRHSNTVWFLPVCLLASVGAAQATIVHVPADQSTIQSAVNDASDGDTVLIANGTYTGPGNVDVDFGGKNITVTSQHGAASTIIDCQDSSSAYHRGFYLHSGETTAVISGLTIKNGNETGDQGDSQLGGGICIDNSSNATVKDCTISGNAASYGGGLYNENDGSGTTSVTNCTVTGNAASYGGSICNLSYSDGPILVTNCTLTSNTAIYGSGICNLSYSDGLISVTGCTISGNAASYGGGLYNENDGSGTTSVTNCTVLSNTADYGGGIGNLSYSEGSTSVTNCTVFGNTGSTSGGGIYNGNASASNGHSGTITLTNCIIYGDTAPSAAEISDDDSSPVTPVTCCDVQGGYTGTRNIDADPKFVSATDFHLQAGSPCLSAGTASGAPATDIEGTNRPSSPSVGAYDWPSSAASPVRLLWKNTGGLATIWTINIDGTVVSTAALTNDGMTALSIADGTNGAVQLLWKSPAGAASVWTLAPDGTHTATPNYGPYGDWQVQALAVGMDNLTRLFWKNATGSCTVWTIGADGTVASTPTYGPYPSGTAGGQWQAQGLAVGADNRTRLFWKSTQGQASVWTFAADGGTHTATAAFGPYGDWQAQAFAVGADNLTRLLWKNTAGSCTIWTIGRDQTVTSTVPYGPYGDWQAQAFTVGGDGLTHLFWKDAAGSCTVWSLGTDGTASSTVPYGPYGDWQATALSAGN